MEAHIEWAQFKPRYSNLTVHSGLQPALPMHHSTSSEERKQDLPYSSSVHGGTLRSTHLIVLALETYVETILMEASAPMYSCSGTGHSGFSNLKPWLLLKRCHPGWSCLSPSTKATTHLTAWEPKHHNIVSNGRHAQAEHHTASSIGTDNR